jgi:hypothetical protein
MPATFSAITVTPGQVSGISGYQTVAVSITNLTGTTMTAYTAANGSTPFSFPTSISSPTTFFLVSGGPMLVSALAANGQQVAGPGIAAVVQTDGSGGAASVQCVTSAAINERPYGPSSGTYIRSIGNQTSAATTLNRLVYTNVDIGMTTAIDRIGVNITVLAASSTVRLGVYMANTSGFPGTLLLDAGTVASDTAGYKEITLTPLTLVPGRYWLAAVAQGGTPSVQINNSSSHVTGTGYMQTMTGVSNAQMLASNPTTIFDNVSVAGALPATATPTYDGAFVNGTSVCVRAV